MTELMKKTDKQPASNDELRPEHDFRGGERGKYAKRYRDGSNIIPQALRTYLKDRARRWLF